MRSEQNISGGTRELVTTELPPCPKCKSTFTYEDGPLLICPECAHEWSATAAAPVAAEADGLIVKDAHGTRLQDGDSVTIIKDLKVKGATSALKVGTRVKNIKLVEGDHNIDCRIDGFGAMQLKSEFVKKA
jgi:protein PhnA